MKKCSSKILSIAYYAPDTVLKTGDVEKRLRFKERLGLPYGLLERLTGCKEHRISTPDTNASDLAAHAAERAIEKAGIAKEEIDTLLFCACCQDIYEPATANIVQKKLGVFNAHVLDVQNACNSFVNGMDIADSLIGTGKSKIALVTTGEVLSKYTNMNVRNRKELDRKAAALTLGDGGGAVIMTKKDSEDTGLLTTYFSSDGNYWNLGVVMAHGTMYPRAPVDPDLTYFQSDSEKLLHLAVERIPKAIKKVLDEVGWTTDELDIVLGHQVTIKVIKDILSSAGIPFEKTVVTVDRFGNTAAASIPITIGVALETGRLKPGMKTLLVGGAAGFSIGIIALIW